MIHPELVSLQDIEKLVLSFTEERRGAYTYSGDPFISEHYVYEMMRRYARQLHVRPASRDTAPSLYDQDHVLHLLDRSSLNSGLNEGNVFAVHKIDILNAKDFLLHCTSKQLQERIMLVGNGLRRIEATRE